MCSHQTLLEMSNVFVVAVIRKFLQTLSLFLLWKDDNVGALLKLINRRFSRESHYKNFSVHLFNKSKLPL